MLSDYRTQFLEKIQRTPSCISYRFRTPENFTFTAGQHMVVELDADLAHPLTISSSPKETEYLEFTKRMTGSDYCQRLESLKKGENINVKGPLGRFCFDYDSGTVVMIAGGIGITPFRSILTNLAGNMKKPCSIILLYGNLHKEDIAFRDELENLSIPQYRLIHVLSDPTGVENAYQGFVTSEIIAREIPDWTTAHHMVSGPPVMVAAIKEALLTLNVEEKKIRTDVFLGYTAG